MRMETVAIYSIGKHKSKQIQFAELYYLVILTTSTLTIHNCYLFQVELHVEYLVSTFTCKYLSKFI